jgi:hypothetical protein
MQIVKANGVIAILEAACEYLKTSKGGLVGNKSQALLAINIAADAKNEELHRAFPGARNKAIEYLAGIRRNYDSAEEYLSEALEAAHALEK